MVLGMDAVFASGLTAFRTATMRLGAAGAQLSAVRPMTIPAASPQDALPTRAVAGQSPAPPPHADLSGRAPSSSDYIDITVELIGAEQQAKLAAKLIETADEMNRTLLDIKA